MQNAMALGLKHTGRLCWTVEHMNFSGLQGEPKDAPGRCRSKAGCAAGTAGWEALKPFKGVLHFDCPIQLDA